MADPVDQIVDVLGLAAACRGRGGVGDEVGLHRLGEELQRSGAHRAVVLRSIAHGEQTLSVEWGAGLRAREHRGGEVDGGVDHIEADEAVGHQVLMQRPRIAAVQLVQDGDALVCGREQRAGAAGEVADLDCAERIGVAPAGAARSAIGGHREPGQQRRGGRTGVEGCKELPVGDQPLEHHAGQVVRARHATVNQTANALPETLEDG